MDVYKLCVYSANSSKGFMKKDKKDLHTRFTPPLVFELRFPVEKLSEMHDKVRR